MLGGCAAAAAIRVIPALDKSYLFIQGPPGTGKTYTAAEAVASLLKQGFRVGVSSNSHKAINNALQNPDVQRQLSIGALRAELQA